MSTPTHTRYITIKNPPSPWDQVRVLLGLLVGALLGLSLARQDVAVGESTDLGALFFTYLLAIAASVISWANAPALVAVGVGAIGSAVGWELLILSLDVEERFVGSRVSHFGMVAGSAYIAAGLVIAIRHRKERKDTAPTIPTLSPIQRVGSTALGILAGVAVAFMASQNWETRYPQFHVGYVLIQTTVIVGIAVALLGIAIRWSRIGGVVAGLTLCVTAATSFNIGSPLLDDVVFIAMACAAVIVSAVLSLRSEAAYTADTTTIALKSVE